MKALQWDGKNLRVNDIPVPQRKDGESLLRVLKAGVCNTDLEILRGYHDFHGTLGHEFIALVEECDDKSLVGHKVVCDINCACYSCAVCKSGLPHHCPDRITIGINGKDGAFAEYINVPQENIFPIPDSLPLERAVFAEPVAASLEILEQVALKPGDEIAVLGDGKLGLLITMCLAGYGYSVTLIGHHPENLDRLNGIPVQFFDSLPDEKFNLVIEATGNKSGFESAVSLTAPRGTIVLKSTVADGFNFNTAPIVINEITLIGSRCGPMDKAVELLNTGMIEPERLIDETYEITESANAVYHANKKGVLKVLIDF